MQGSGRSAGVLLCARRRALSLERPRVLVYDGSGKVPVYYRGGPVPDIFGDEVQVVVEGKYNADGTFVANTLLAKCPSKFETDGTAEA